MIRALDADEIVPGLWQGDFIAASRSREHGFQVLVLCAKEWQFEGEEIEGVHIIRAPNEDDERKMPDARCVHAFRVARECANRIVDGQKVLVTCAAGVNRSGLISALTLHFLYGWSGAYCREVIRKQRKPAVGLMPLCNRQFTNMLQELPARKGMVEAPKGFYEPPILVVS